MQNAGRRAQDSKSGVQVKCLPQSKRKLTAENAENTKEQILFVLSAFFAVKKF